MTRPSNKPTLRQQCRSARQSLPSTSLQQFSKNISSKLLTLDVFQQALTVGSYMPIDNEVDTSDIHQTCWQKKQNLLLPVITGNMQMEFISYQQGTTLKNNRFNIPEPDITVDTPHYRAIDIDCLLIPMVGFDVKGNRLGYGGGYYDKFLQADKKKPVCIGLAFEVQKIMSIEKEKWDISMDIIVTEKEIYNTKVLNSL